MNVSIAIADCVNSEKNRPMGGTLRIWGEWFGKPYDNFHEFLSAKAEDRAVTIWFDKGETLTIYDPEDVVLAGGVFRVGRAARVRWEWFFYGAPQVAKNRYYLDYEWLDGRIEGRSNVTWYVPKFETSSAAPAVEFNWFK